ncbi:hypothetical protein MMYC01_208434, partial [Madurella mycetomatis]
HPPIGNARRTQASSSVSIPLKSVNIIVPSTVASSPGATRLLLMAPAWPRTNSAVAHCASGSARENIANVCSGGGHPVTRISSCSNTAYVSPVINSTESVAQNEKSSMGAARPVERIHSAAPASPKSSPLRQTNNYPTNATVPTAETQTASPTSGVNLPPDALLVLRTRVDRSVASINVTVAVHHTVPAHHATYTANTDTRPATRPSAAANPPNPTSSIHPPGHDARYPSSRLDASHAARVESQAEE